MTVHKLSAGDGYTYLTRQVASADEPRAAGQSLADYYVARGNPPGVWAGRGAELLGVSGTVVTEAQMKALFGAGRHPDGVQKLGATYPVYANLAPYPQRVAQRIEEFACLSGRPPSATERNRIAASEARRGRRAVAGFDLVCTPVKSASVLWALGGAEIRRAVEDAHHEAVAGTIGWLEQHAAFTRVGRGGVAQIDTTGLVCAMFDHRESRAGDPDLHTHVAVANKVCGVDGKWRSLDARGLYALGVAASERYNTRFEDALARRLGVQFVDRPSQSRDLRPVREIDGVPLELVRHFSRRRAAIEDRYAELRADYRSTHGREPDRATQLQLAQQATLETREAKREGRTFADQVTDWTNQAAVVIGRRRLASLVESVTGRAPVTMRVSDHFVYASARQVLATIAEQRSTWTIWNLYAETERALRGVRFASVEERERATAAVVGRASGPELSIRISEPELVAEPEELVRASDRVSVFRPHGSDRFTTSEILLAEDDLVAAGRSNDAPHMDPVPLQAALAIHQARTGLALDPGQHQLVEAFATSPAQIVVGIGPAGAGKTTAMRAFAAAWTANGGRVVPLATSSRAAHVLGHELDVRAENLHKFLHENHQRRSNGLDPQGTSDDWFRLRAGDVILVDEAGMSGTLQLRALLRLATQAGATIRLLGDPAQLAAVDAGGALSLLEREVGATHLTTLHRFTDPDEGTATLALRNGDPNALAFYTDRDRISSGSREAMLEHAYENWARDIRAGHTSLLIAATSDDVSALNARARLERVLARQVEGGGVVLHDGNLAGVGDWIVTRSNARTLTYGGLSRSRGRSRWVHNGDTWRVTRRHRDGALTVRHLETNARLRLPADYVAGSVELGYASTAHRAQGATTHSAHALITPEMTREALYVASTRGRTLNRWYVATQTEPAPDPAGPSIGGTDTTSGLRFAGGCDREPEPPRTTEEVLTAVLRRTGAEQSATATVRAVMDESIQLPALIARYEHARTRAATDALHLAATDLPVAERTRILTDRGAPHLAAVLADAVGRGAHGPTLLRRAIDLDELDAAASPALVVAARIEDHPHTLGIPDDPPTETPTTHKPTPDEPTTGKPLPWLPGPDVGHPGWTPYLHARAALIRHRAIELGTLAAAYREHYKLPPASATASPTSVASLGGPPEPNTRQAHAYNLAIRELTELTEPTEATAITPRPAPTTGAPALSPTRYPAQNRDRSLSR